MKNYVMLSVLISLLVLGCIMTQQGAQDQTQAQGAPSQVQQQGAQSQAKQPSTSGAAEWCEVGSISIKGKSFTISGLTSYKNAENLCHLAHASGEGNIEFYMGEDGMQLLKTGKTLSDEHTWSGCVVLSMPGAHAGTEMCYGDKFEGEEPESKISSILDQAEKS